MRRLESLLPVTIKVESVEKSIQVAGRDLPYSSWQSLGEIHIDRLVVGVIYFILFYLLGVMFIYSFFFLIDGQL